MGSKRKRSKETSAPKTETSSPVVGHEVSRPWPVIIALAIAAVFVAVTTVATNRHSLTWDEPSFIGAGYLYLTEGDFRWNPSHPPLLQVLEAAPLVATGTPRAPGSFEEWSSTGNPIVGFGHSLLFDEGRDTAKMARLARLPIAILGGVLVFVAFLLGRRLYGDRPGLAAATLCAVCPNLLAHAGLATEDLGCAALGLAALWLLHRAKERPRPIDWVFCGVVTGLALVAKYTSLLLVPAFSAIAIVEVVRRRDTLRHWVCGLVIVGLGAAVVVAVTYGARNGIGLYVAGLKSIYADLVTHNYYLLGRFSPDGWWYYTPVAFLVKTPVATLVLLAAAVVAAILRKGRARSVGDDVLYLLVPALVIVGASLFDRANFGLRRILPAIPFLLIFAARPLAAALESRRRGLVAVVTVAIAATALESAAAFPDYLSFFNVVVGGPSAGYRYLDDSNLDWGQDLPALARWQAAHPEAGVIKFSYFGSAEPASYGVDAVPMKMEDFVRPSPGYYAVSVQRLIRVREPGVGLGPEADWLARHSPIARAGRSIYIFRF